MQSYQADSAALPQATRDRGTSYHLALADIADEIVGTLARLSAYVGTLALLAILGLAALDQLSRLGDDEPELRSAWASKDGCDPDSIAGSNESTNKSKTYDAFRHAWGGSRAAAGPQRHACDPAILPDGLAGPEKLQLRGTL